MIINNGTVLNHDFKFAKADIVVEDDKIRDIGSIGGNADIDATDCYVVPGFVDTHMHGAMGKSFIDFDDDTCSIVAEYEAKNGTTALVPALSATPKAKLLGCIEYMKACCTSENEKAAKIYGFHLEGPFFSEKYKGAHLPENIRNTDPYELMEYINASDNFLKIITLAPELPSADDTIIKAIEKGVCVSIGHSSASYEQALHALSLGASQGTHIFNAMSPLNHRDPGMVGAILLTDAKAELICDFFHIHKDIIKMVYNSKGSDRINIITDSELGTGLPDGEYMVNGRKIIVKDKKAYTDDGTIAGGTSCMIDGVRNLVSIGIPLEEACKMASKNPAQTIGEFDKIGSIKEGKIADLVVLDKKDLSIKNVIIRGKLLY
ncbi:MAG: N-acetylglucosamine-6-phosphate deacetylase [Eubacteriales bacterium]|nr:N-acetylglucosamine-6-phosphate deacetylase [Eubacteriales bacterium]